MLASHAAYADISGKVFRDFNANGTQDNSSGFNERGVGGVAVSCTDSAGGSGSTTTSADDATLGQYTLTGCSGNSRVVFNTTLPLDYSASFGTDNHTNVQFVSAPQTNVNFALNYPADYCSADPDLLVPAQHVGDGTGSNANVGALYRFPYSTSGISSPNNQAVMTKAQLGSTWGLAFDRTRQRVFQAAFLKRHAGLKDGLGTIYIGAASGSGISYERGFNVQGLTPSNGGAAIDLGTVCRSASCASDAGNTGLGSDYVIPADPGQPSIDLDTFGKVGKVGLGGLELTPDNQQLWAVNLHQRALIRMDATLDSNAFPGSVQQYALDGANGIPSCSGGVFRPFALTFYRDKGYLGGVCDASSSVLSSDLTAYVVSFDPNNVAAGFTNVANLNLNYNRGGDRISPDGSARYYWQWHPWRDSWDDYGLTSSTEWIMFHAVPIVSDIAFAEDESMTIALMDRFSQQVGREQSWAVSDTTERLDGRSVGDLVHFCKDSAGVFHLEGSAQCAVNFASSNGPQNNGAYFDDINGDNTDGALGGILYLKGTGEMVSTVFDPFSPSHSGGDPDSYFTQGLHWLDAKNGSRTDYFRIMDSLADGGFGKASGLGELEIMCPPSPTEIGNRVWLDTDKDGTQDAGENGIPNVQVQLLAGATVVATATTDSDGTYYFSSATGTNTSSKQYGLSLQPNTAYTVKFPTTVNVTGTAYTLTTASAGGDTLLDSNAASSGEVSISTTDIPMSGANNHSFDVGYVENPQTDLALSKTVTKTTVKKGETVQYVLTVSNTGAGAASAVEVKDSLPAGVSYQSHVASQGSYSDSTGIWTVGTLNNGESATLTIDVQVK